jgi:muconolactone delta-isomerase
MKSQPTSSPHDNAAQAGYRAMAKEAERASHDTDRPELKSLWRKAALAFQHLIASSKN